MPVKTHIMSEKSITKEAISFPLFKGHIFFIGDTHGSLLSMINARLVD